MTKQFKWLVKNGRVILLRRTVGLFGEQWECFGNFDDKGDNAARGKRIIEQLNECAGHSDNYNEHE